jgi:transcriptional regulator with XRE-family HTH domain
MDTRGIEIIEHVATEEKPFQFIDCGLDNVYLVGIKYFEKPDGTFSAEIPAVKQLLNLIASDLIFSDSQLRGVEMRFLRKRLGLKASEMAKHLSLDGSTLSRIEGEKQDFSVQVSQLMKFVYILLCEDLNMEESKKRLLQIISEHIKTRHSSKIVMKVNPQNEWTEIPMAA